MKKFIISLIYFYKKQISPALRPACVFLPTCSEYTLEAIEKYGVLKGTWLGIRRVLRCHPWQKNHFDPVP